MVAPGTGIIALRRGMPAPESGGQCHKPQARYKLYTGSRVSMAGQNRAMQVAKTCQRITKQYSRRTITEIVA
jgi:hypothetical protein